MYVVVLLNCGRLPMGPRCVFAFGTYTSSPISQVILGMASRIGSVGASCGRSRANCLSNHSFQGAPNIQQSNIHCTLCYASLFRRVWLGRISWYLNIYILKRWIQHIPKIPQSLAEESQPVFPKKMNGSEYEYFDLCRLGRLDFFEWRVGWRLKREEGFS